MSTRELLREALQAIRAHTLRSSLALLGIVIGVATLVGVVSLITGLNGFVIEVLHRLGPDVYMVRKLGPGMSRAAFLDALKRRDLDWNDYLVLRRTLTLADEVAAQVSRQTGVKHRDRQLRSLQIYGTTANAGQVERLNIIGGRYFTTTEDDTAQTVAIIGWDIKDELFPLQDPVGREILVGDARYRVIGLLAKQGRLLGVNKDNVLYVPIQAYRRQFGDHDPLSFLIQAQGGVPGLEASVEEVRALMRALRHTSFRSPDPFVVVSAETAQTLVRKITGKAQVLALLIASVSLGIGGIVIMNIMLVAVVERTPEIGMRRAVGARKRDIKRQFLIEAALLSSFGGALGVPLGGVIALGAQRALNFPAEVTPGIVAMGLVLSTVAGIAAGYWPAHTAANLPVVDSLRAE
ncbi:MAG: ABC transporter permease [Vicinamibacteria bacterium]|nr:ABC transporter permease [Vicinamibacteria bacterium]